MKSKVLPIVFIFVTGFLSRELQAASTIDAAHPYAYGANIGWLNCSGDATHGAVIGEYVCSGYLYAANVGWISLGSGTPANGIQYQNNSATDFGVNLDGLGNLHGYAYGANIGWINFETNGAPKVDLYTGNLSGYAWSANCGWISLSNSTAFVQTDAIASGADSDSDGIPDAWELGYTNTLGAFSASTDSDGDGVPDSDEYLAGTSPTDPADYLRITDITRGIPHDTYVTLQWTSVPTRFYSVEQTPALGAGFMDYATLPFLGASNAGFDDYGTNSFYRIRAFRPLTP